MNWTEVTIKTTTEAVEAISNILMEERCGGVMIEDPKDFLFQKKNELDWDYVEEEVFNKSGQDGVLIKTYIPEERNVLELIETVKARISLLPSFGLDIGEGSVSLSNVNESDWANEWKKYYKPTKVGKKIVVKPSWEDYEKQEGDLIIELDPGMAFGTGTHLLELPFRIDMHQREWHFTRIKRFFSQAYHHRGILSDTVKHHRILKFRRHLADDMNRLGFELLQVA